MWNHLKNYNLNKRGKDTIHAVIPTSYHKYISTKILKHTNILTKVNNLPYVSLLDMMPYGAYSITINVRTMTILEIIHEQV